MDDWKSAVRVMRGRDLDAIRHAPGGGRATMFDFAGIGGGKGRTWIGAVSMAPGGVVPPHHHGRHEVAIAITRGTMEIRWGAAMEFAALLEAGDGAYFAPHVPHQERNPSESEPVDFLAFRSDNERIAVSLPETKPVAVPAFVA
jgi:uncharacterized RmlC-like cupin family protein